MNSINCAPDFDQVLSMSDMHRNLNGTAVSTKKEVQALTALRDLFSRIKADEYKNPHIYIDVDRGSAADWMSYEDAADEFEIKNEKEYKDIWLEYYPEEKKWYEAAFAVNKYGYMGLIISDKGHHTGLIKFDPVEDKTYENAEPIFEGFLLFVLERVKFSIKRLEDGIYNAYVSEYLPYSLRTGMIPRSMLWKLDPEVKKYDRDGLSDDEIQEFACNIEKMNSMKESDFRISHFNSGEFFRLCREGYEAAYPERYDASLDDVSLYKLLSDGRDDGLSDIDPRSEDELRRWFGGELQHFNGSHPWEIIPGGNSTHVDFYLRLEKDGTFRLSMAGRYRTHEIVRFFNILCKEREYPVFLFDAEGILDRISGKGSIGILPENVPLTYAWQYFDDDSILDAVHLYQLKVDGVLEDLLPFVTWKKEEPAELA